MLLGDITTQLGVAVGIVLNLMLIFTGYQKLSSIKCEKAKELHERFLLLKDLSNDIDSNFSEVLIILSAITRVELSKEEVLWFLNEPRAFLKLEVYGRLPPRYCKIDLNRGEFALTKKVDTGKKQLLECFKILLIGFLMMLIVGFFWYLIASNLTSTFSIYVAFSFLCIYLILIFFAVNYLISALNNAKKLAGKP